MQMVLIICEKIHKDHHYILENWTIKDIELWVAWFSLQRKQAAKDRLNNKGMNSSRRGRMIPPRTR